ncbi:uncharacterized protein LOC115972080 [Quercus lobata]|uniref:Uncharacterized protein n=1 Tax=Quercus lobata TaxID=97700 RepID=A0A7N2N5M6_QUELO|nr:uncharacterized protein LOC115972080 [Quercus lobata]
MALEVYWYDFVCFGIVGIAFFGALWVLWRKEGSRTDDNTVYESLLVSRPDSDVLVSALPRGHVSTSQLWTSCWRGVHPRWLLLTRFVSFVAMAGFLAWDIVDWDASIFIYYTEWTFALVMVYFALGTLVSAYGCWISTQKPRSDNGARAEFLRRDLEENRTTNSITYRERETKGTIKLQSHYTEEEIRKRAGFWGYLMQTAYQTCGGAVILTDIVFWCVIVPFLSDAHVGLNLLMGFMHTLNAFFLLLDTSLNSLPFPWFRLAYFVLWSCIYVIFQWVIHACGFSWWPYPFLELDVPWAPLWYFCMAVVHIPCYGTYALIIKAKNSFLPRLFPHAFIRSC